MRIYKILSILSSVILMTGCGAKDVTDSEDIQPVTQYYQDISHLYIEESTENTTTNEINYDVKYASWIKYLDYADIMLNKSENEFRKSIAKILETEKQKGINTIYFQVRAFGDSYYKSEIYPKGAFLNNDYDPLQIVVDEAHKLDMSLHAWINPLRCQTAEEYKTVSDDYILKKWYNEFQGKYICNVDGRMWLNPAYEEVQTLVNDGITEILKNYSIDGIHIDDYFYPTVSEEFDSIAFEESKESDLTKWRTENINNLVEAMYQTIKKHNKNIEFGISPQGNINQNYATQYADIKKWCKGGYCDYIVPQIYFGFKNETCPFEQTFGQWYNLTKNSEITMSVGLAVYKQGKEDQWAGSGKNEWQEDKDVIKKQQEYIKQYDNIGYSLYY